MHRVMGLATSLVVFAAGLALSLPPAQAAGSGFVGTIQSPARGDTIATIRGDLTVDPADCPPIVGDRMLTSADPIYATLQDARGGTHAYIEVPQSGGTIYIDQRLSLDPGVYTFVLTGYYWDYGSRPARLPCVALSPTTISVVSETTRARETVASQPSVYEGEAFTVSLVYIITWSDGVVTRQPAPARGATYRLQDRPLGTSDWKTTEVGGPSTKVVAKEPREFRILDGDKVSRSVVVDVIRPTSAREVSDVTVTPASAIAGATLTLSGTIQSQFTDQTWRPSPAGTSFEVQFLPVGADAWIRLYESTVQDVGVVKAQFPMTGSGRYRVTASGAVSASVEVIAIVPTSVVAVEPLVLPTAVAPGGPLNIASTANAEYSDGVYRPVMPGTSYLVEFRPSTTTRAKAAKWRVVRTVAVVKAGVIKARVTARTSGHWRVRIGNTTTPPVFVRVR